MTTTPAHAQAERFLALLGKDPATARLRAFPHKKSQRKQEIGARKGGWDLEQATRWNATRGVYMVINDGGDKREEITACRALFVEWDDRPIDWQLQAWRELGLPEPSLIVTTGHSAHTYWVLEEPMPKEAWEPLQRRLIEHCQSDPACKDPNRVMRVPGFHYVGANDQPTHLVELIHESGATYSAAEIEACLPPLLEQATIPTPAATPPPHRDDLPPRPLEQVRAALRSLPPRVPGEGSYHWQRPAALGYIHAVLEAEPPGTFEQALADLKAHHPQWVGIEQVLKSSDLAAFTAGTFWHWVKEKGGSAGRHDLEAPDPLEGFNAYASNPGDPTPAEARKRTYTELVEATLQAAETSDRDSYAELVAELMVRFRVGASAIQAALMRLLMERHAGGTPTPAPDYTDIFDVEPLDHLVPGFVAANEQTLLYAPKGTGKTVAALLIAKSVVLGQGMLDRSEAPRQGRVLYLATDSGCASMRTQMQHLGLNELPEFQQGNPEKRFVIRGHHTRQGTTGWEATIPEIMWLLRVIQRDQIDLVIIDSAKTCLSLTDLDYTDNRAVGSLLTLFQRVICPHAAVLWLHHDGTQNGHNAGAKVWAELPVMVHRIECVEPPKPRLPGGSGEDETGPPPSVLPRRWHCIKSRIPGDERQFVYCLQPSGEFEVAPDVEIVGNCREAVLAVMRQAMAAGEESLRWAELVVRVRQASGRSSKTIKNTISKMTRGKEPDLRSAGKGRYKLSAHARVRGCVFIGTELRENPVIERDLVGPDPSPDGTKSGPFESPDGTGSGPPSGPTKPQSGTDVSPNVVPTHTHPPRARARELCHDPAPPADAPLTGLPEWADQLEALVMKHPTATPYDLANLLAFDGPVTTPARIAQVLELLKRREAEFWEEEAA